MLKTRIFSIAAFAVVVSPAAFALNNRSAVSVNGLDTNACTTVSPCRSFTTAIPATAPGGEVIALTTAGYGPFTVSNTMTISGAPGVHAAITATSGDGITVNAGASDIVILRNLVLIGAGGSQGIDHMVAGELHVIGCLVRGFTSIGIIVNTNTAAKVSVDDTVILDNSFGMYLAGDFFGASIVSAALTNTTIMGNNEGLRVLYSTKLVVANSTIAYNSNVGIFLTSTAGTGALVADAMLESNTIAHNVVGISLSASGGNNSARVTMSQNVIAFSTSQGVVVSGAGVAYSFNNNRFVGNAVDGGPFTAATLQ
jgi:hypothetical protein